jgi:hypothetical protein
MSVLKIGRPVISEIIDGPVQAACEVQSVKRAPRAASASRCGVVGQA